MAIKLGMEAVLKYKVGAGAWTELKNVKDVTLNLEAGEADVTTRGNGGWRANIATLKDASLEFEMVWDTADDDFTAIVAAMRLGRRIYDNLRKAMGFILSVHIPIAGLALAPLLFGLPVLFTPIHIAFLEMVIDPVCSLAFEADRKSVV